MKSLAASVALSFALLWGTPAFPCGVHCLHCTLTGGPPQCPGGGCPSCTRASNRACESVLYQDGLPCQQFGYCVQAYNCLAPGLVSSKLKENLAPEETAPVINAADHPWIASKSFVGELQKYSEPLSRLVAVKQQAYLSGKYRHANIAKGIVNVGCLLYTSPSPRDRQKSRMPSSA